jgi:hypothetical protein
MTTDRICARCGLPAEFDWNDSPNGPVHENASVCIAELKHEVARLQTERRGLWKFVHPVDGAQVVYVGVHAVSWHKITGEEPTAGFVQADLDVAKAA